MAVERPPVAVEAALPFTVAPDAGALLSSLGEMLDGTDLSFIAKADYGRDVPDHLAALRLIARTGGVPQPLAWVPREVLELVRWDEPPPDLAHERRLWRHAFACCGLVRAYGDVESQRHLFGENQSLIGLVTSLASLAAIPLPRVRRAVVRAADDRGAALLAWLVPRLPEGEAGEPAFFGLGLLWFALATDVPDPGLLALIEWIMRAEDAVAAPWITEFGRPVPGRWLLDTTSYDQRHPAWRALGTLLPGRLRRRHGAEVAEGVRLLAAMLAP